jgi:amidase
MTRLAGEEGVIGALEKHNVDVLISPTESDPIATFTARIGLPAITVPLGFFTDDTPVEKTRGYLITIAPRVP